MKSVASAIVALCLFGVAVTAAAAADEAAIRASIERLVPGSAVERVRPSSMPGLAEVIVGGQVVYVSDDGRFVLNGSLIDARQQRDLTEGTRNEVRAQVLDALPAEARIRYAPQSPTERSEGADDVDTVAAPGTPEHRVTVFTATDCGYCRRFHADIDAYLARGIAVDYVLIPLAGPGSAADAIAARVHCARDRHLAFTEATFGRPFEAEACESAYQQGVASAHRLGIRNTPIIVASDGRQLGGYLTPEQLSERLLATGR
jgi:thiol:disulfide interchange protein DsbC